MSWTLDNAEKLAADAPRTFFIPPAELRHALKRGDEVKLVFRLEREDGEAAVERMWVEVVETEPYAGRLRNDPRLTGVIDFGDRVEFAAEHVCAYAYTNEELGYDPTRRCPILKRVAEATDPPPVLLLNDEGEWEAHAQDESEAELHDGSNVLRWTLGYLTDRFPQTTEPVREGSSRRGLLRRRPRGMRWEWQGDRYARVGG